MGMSKNGNGPVNSTYHFRRATGFAQKTMSTNNGTSRSELQQVKKKIQQLPLYYGNKSADDGIKLPKQSTFTSQNPCRKCILFSTGILMPYQLLFQCIDKGEVPQGKHLALFWIRTRLWLIVWDVNLALNIPC